MLGLGAEITEGHNIQSLISNEKKSHLSVDNH